MACGTDGSRADASLREVCFRVGVLLTQRARQKGRAGVMITAPHSKARDNSVKIIDYTGEVLSTPWERKAAQIVRAEDPTAAFWELIDARDKGEESISRADKAVVYVGHDSCPPSLELTEALVEGVRSAGGEEKNFEPVTAPQLRFLVQLSHKRGSHEVAVEDYYTHMREKTEQFKALARQTASKYQTKLFIDCADGIGGPAVKKLDAMSALCEVETLNDASSAEVHRNEGCGAEFVHEERKLPRNFDWEKHAGAKFASLDGDAERLVYFFTEDAHLGVIDGDRIAALIAVYVQKLLKEIKCKDDAELASKVSLAVVQTSYANSGSTAFLNMLGVPVESAPSGVENLRPKAELFDIGLYFEASGHGCVLAKVEKIRTAIAEHAVDPEQEEARLLLALLEISNQAAGDAMSVMLMYECVLAQLDMDLTWAAKMYQDLPSKMSKVQVKDPSLFETLPDNETVLVKPAGVQEQIQKICAEYEGARCFVRPSGSDGVLRVYAEALAQQEAEEIVLKTTEVLQTQFSS